MPAEFLDPVKVIDPDGGNEELHAGWFHGKNVLITGGLGFIGSTLGRRLCDLGAKVLLVDSLIPEYGGTLFNIAGYEGRVTVNIADVRDQYGMGYLVQGQDIIFNLAGQSSHLDSMRDPYTDLEINCRSQLSILEACRLRNPAVRIVYASTRQIYGKPLYLPVDEKHPLAPTDVNGINKMAGEWYHVLFNNVYGIRACGLRLTNTYGPRMRVKDARQTFLGWWLRLLIEGREIEIFGDGLQLRDFNYVTDVVDAMLLAASTDNAHGKVMNLGGSEVISLRDLALVLMTMVDDGRFRLIEFPSDRKAIDIGDYYGNFELATNVLGWKPRVLLRDGLEQTVAYFREFQGQYW
jgi:UDP-glucose 4-epimerase